MPAQIECTVKWDGEANDGLWHNPLNWGDDVLPAPGDNVCIDDPNDPTITHSNDSGKNSINALESMEALVLSGGTLSVATTVQVNNTFTLSGGTLRSKLNYVSIYRAAR